MQNNYEVLELFPVPVYTTTLPDELSSIIPFFDQQEVSTENDNSIYGYRSKDSYILDKPECVNIKGFILDNAKQFADMLGYDYDEYRFSQSWISVKAPGQAHTAHTHPNSLISGVFYYGEQTEETPSMMFHKNINNVNAHTITPKMVDNMESLKYASYSFSVKFAPGLLILFPSHIVHSVPVNKSSKFRHSVAFNIIPEIGFGDEKLLTELLFKKELNESKLYTKKKNK